MTAVRRGGPADLPLGSTPRRIRPPRWLDLRLVLGVLLVLGSVLVGARVVTAADATESVWAATGDLAAGTVLTADDLVAVDVRLDTAAAGYLATTTRPVGHPLARAVSRDELLPRSAVATDTRQVQLALPVQAAFAPPGLGRGEVVDVYAITPAAAGAVDGEVSLVRSGATVQSVSGRSEGVLSSSGTTIQVVVWVDAGQVEGVLAGANGRELVVVVRESVEEPAAVGSAAGAPDTTPAD